MNVTFYVALHRDGGESVSLTSTLTKTVKISGIDGLPCLPYTFTHSDMLRIRLSHKIEALCLHLPPHKRSVYFWFLTSLQKALFFH